MKQNDGSDYLIPQDEWVPESELQGNEAKVLTHPVTEKAFRKILEDWSPEHNICLLSTCTSSRPYSKSQKWKKYLAEFEGKADLIVFSSAGIIPQKYWSCYPYLTYDSYSTSSSLGVFLNTQTDRMKRFFDAKHYDLIVVVAKPLSAFRVCTLKFMESYKGKVELIPTMCEREADRENGFRPYGVHYPELAKSCFAHTKRAIHNAL